MLGNFEVRNLSCMKRMESGAEVPILKDVNLSVEKGETLGLIGESGAGKSMTLSAILGLQAPDIVASGNITISGETIDLALGSEQMAPYRGREVGLVMQQPWNSFDPLVKIGRQLTEAARLQGKLDKRMLMDRANQLLLDVGLDVPAAITSSYPHELSGGMLQRAAIAMALMTEPQVIIADEPTSALDANLRVDIMTLFRRIARERDCSVIIVSHDLTLTKRFVDRVAVMYCGRIVEYGDSESVFESPHHPYTQALAECTPSVDGDYGAELGTIVGRQPDLGHWPEGCPFWPRCRYTMDICRVIDPLTTTAGQRSWRCHLPEL